MILDIFATFYDSYCLAVLFKPLFFPCWSLTYTVISEIFTLLYQNYGWETQVIAKVVAIEYMSVLLRYYSYLTPEYPAEWWCVQTKYTVILLCHKISHSCMHYDARKCQETKACIKDRQEMLSNWQAQMYFLILQRKASKFMKISHLACFLCFNRTKWNGTKLSISKCLISSVNTKLFSF